MYQRIKDFVQNNRRFIPMAATATLVFVAYYVGTLLYPGMRNPQVFFNIFRNNPYLLIIAVGSTLVILTGGIDLSVSGMIALTSVASAALLRDGMNAWVVILLMLLMGLVIGAIMGSFIAYLKVQPFIATLAGMWFTRGMCFFISDDAIAIKDPIFINLLGKTKILIPGLTEIAESQGNPAPYVSISTVMAFLIFGIAIYVAQYTRFGRTIYAIGGQGGRNEISARLMGLPVETTKLLVYTINGFCSAFAGVAFAIFVASGHGLYANMYELDAIASVVIGGTSLAGGSGYVFGTLFGVIVFGITQTLIQFNGQLSSWWTRIVIGLLTLAFIGVQSLVASQKGGEGKLKLTGEAEIESSKRKKRAWLYRGIAAALLIVLAIVFVPKLTASVSETTAAGTGQCELLPYRRELADEFVDDGAIIVYERNGGSNCIDEIYAIYTDGRIIGDNGEITIEGQITEAEVELLLAGIDNLGWFTNSMFDTWHVPCKQCYGYYLTVSYNDMQKTVKGVDGGTDAPSDYWQVISLVKAVVPKFTD